MFASLKDELVLSTLNGLSLLRLRELSCYTSNCAVLNTLQLKRTVNNTT